MPARDSLPRRTDDLQCSAVSAEGNPYAAASGSADPITEDSVRRMANLAAVFAVASLLYFALLAPVAVFLGHRALRAIRRGGVGLQHRGAALVAVVVGWPLIVLAALQLLVRQVQSAGIM
jgi:hypothetical protein